MAGCGCRGGTIDRGGETMSTADRDGITPVFAADCPLPELTPGAAAVLLRILRKALHKQLSADRAGGPIERCERDVA